MQLDGASTRRHLPLVTGARGTRPHELLPEDETDARYQPRFAIWELTLRCTSRCRHCGSRAGASTRPNELSVEEALALADQLADLGVLEVSLIGGEAFLHDGFLRIVERIARRGIKVAIATGGVGVDAELARSAAAAGLGSVSVSIDGIGKTHDALRGVRRGYEAAVEALGHFRAAGVQIGVNSQFNRRNLADLEGLADLVLAEGAKGWQVAITVAMGEAADRPEILLQPYDVLELIPRLAQQKERLAEHGVLLWPGNNIGYFGPHERTLRGTSGAGHYAGCGAARSVIGIESDGSIKGCPSLPTNPYSAGTIREHSLRELWQRAPVFQAQRARTKDSLWGFCGDCYYASVCRGG
ncbi:MAG TPA: radical SAM protein, partial [Polyangiaceae bacterium]|nr:radical SAM protein [Polyangiaceae bacterium]